MDSTDHCGDHLCVFLSNLQTQELMIEANLLCKEPKVIISKPSCYLYDKFKIITWERVFANDGWIHYQSGTRFLFETEEAAIEFKLRRL